jgi:uncharacterized protein YjbI with pentapeptide repeats
MANEEHLRILKQGVATWNRWRDKGPARPDLSEADLFRADLSEADLSGAHLSKAILSWANLSRANLRAADLSEADLFRADLSEAILYGAHLRRANLSGANLSEADLRGAHLSKAILGLANLSRAKLRTAVLSGANLSGAGLNEAMLRWANLSRANLRRADLVGANLCRADLSGADLSGANLSGADLNEADLSGANLSGANLTGALLIETNFEKANLTECVIYGISAWALKLEGASQSNLIITPPDEPTITVDNLEVAQFIYLLLNNEKIRDVIDTITTKVVLILGRFTPERRAVLDVIRDELRKRNYLPVLFDFNKPASRDLTETVRTLAHLARFIIADITEPRSIPHELQAIVPDLAVPVQPLLLEGSTGEYGMFQDLRKYDWVLEVYQYDSLEDLVASLGENVIAPAEAKAKELEKR